MARKNCEDIEKSMGQNKSKEVYELVKHVSKSLKQRITAIKSEAGEIQMDKEQTKERWTE